MKRGTLLITAMVLVATAVVAWRGWPNLSNLLPSVVVSSGDVDPLPNDTSGPRIEAVLRERGLIDPYFADVMLEVAQLLVAMPPRRWAGVQVNGTWRAGWLNLYQVDAARITQDDWLEPHGVAGFNASMLAGGALAHAPAGIVFFNSAAQKRLTAATVRRQLKLDADLTAGLAAVDAAGLQAQREHWNEPALRRDTPTNVNAGRLLRGALSFVLAHEMGHLQQGIDAAPPVNRQQLQGLSARERDERHACPETLPEEFQMRQRTEAEADRLAAARLGQLCRAPGDETTHAVATLGTGWYFVAATSDKLLAMGRSSASPHIERMLRGLIGDAPYEASIARQAEEQRRGGVKLAFPTSHPPDHQRMQLIEDTLRSSPCGAGSLVSGSGHNLEQLRGMLCRRLTTERGAK